MNLHWYHARFGVKSMVASGWQSDTIFGHLCWALRYAEGEKALDEFLALYDIGEPPVILSDGFPGDLLPRPLASVAQRPRATGSGNLEQERCAFRQAKKAKGARFLSTDGFRRALNGETVTAEDIGFEQRRSVLKNQIDRLTGTTGGEGHLYEFQEYHWSSVSVYMNVAKGFETNVEKLLRHIESTGYGKKKSSGYGQVKLESFEPFDGFPVPSDGNGFVSLSAFNPSARDPVKGAWQTIVKYGKMGEEYATGGNPFKNPLLMFQAGSTFYDMPVREFYGRMVRGLSGSYPQAVQYGLALPVPMKLP